MKLAQDAHMSGQRIRSMSDVDHHMLEGSLWGIDDMNAGSWANPIIIDVVRIDMF
jgi:hypothetical protein